ncbi:MAG: peptidoglycan DD-metalloendopeptidase family protein [Acidimicrobiales bacterium]|nr:peptidoglycan DD-metalloendopeptidase family protein [Acidimicrobiales bacterium]
MSSRRTAVAVVLSVLLSGLAVAGRAPAAAADPPAHVPPVDAPVVDPFRAPASDFGPGNRGLTYDLDAGTDVRASAPGTVTFAGPVAGTLHVTVLHDDGLRTSYSFLESVGVRRGQTVRRGDVVGTGGRGFHFGVRAGDAYLDPAALFERIEVRVRLVPHDEPLPAHDAGVVRERRALVEVVRERGLLGRIADTAVDVGRASADGLSAGYHLLRDLDPSRAALDVVAAYRSSGGDCTVDEVATPAAPADGHVAVLVAGYGSNSVDAAVDDVDTASLGYAVGDVVRYSYRGGRAPRDGLAPDLAAIEASPYERDATFGDLRTEGRELADLVEAVALARPGSTIDVVAHSQGGLVTRLALAELHRRGRLGSLGTVVTMGTPHRGTEWATGATVLDPVERADLHQLVELLDIGVDVRAESLAQMAESSSLVEDLADAGVPDGVTLRTIAASGDLIVPADKSAVGGHASARVGLYGPWAHDQLPGAPATTRELALALAGRAPGCRGTADRVLDAVLPEGIGFGANALVSGYAL